MSSWVPLVALEDTNSPAQEYFLSNDALIISPDPSTTFVQIYEHFRNLVKSQNHRFKDLIGNEAVVNARKDTKVYAVFGVLYKTNVVPNLDEQRRIDYSLGPWREYCNRQDPAWIPNIDIFGVSDRISGILTRILAVSFCILLPRFPIELD
jgi:hypothetical protein